jgi:hypothetical protein
MIASRLAALLALAPAAARAAPPLDEAATEAVVADVRALQDDVAAMRALPFRSPVPVSLEDGAQVREHMMADLDDPDHADEVAAFGATLALFRFGPADLDVRKVYADILEESIAGYYDPDDRRLVLVVREGQPFDDGLDRRGPEGVAASHELVHALQDQHFDLWRLQDRDFSDDDVQIALSALIEGDATWSMMLFSTPEIRLMPQLIDLAAELEAFGAGDAAAAPGSALAAAPPLFASSLLFPYVHGLVFARDAWVSTSDFSAIDAAFAAPPLSSEQILHPEKFLTARPDWPTRLRLDERAAALDAAVGVADVGARAEDTNTLGEVGIRWLLESVPEAARAAVTSASAGWDGDRYRVWRGADGGVFGAWATTWDRPSDAREFSEAIRGWVRHARAGGGSHEARAGGWTTWAHDGRAWAVGLDGRDVHVLIDVPEPALGALQASLRDLPRGELRTLDQAAPAKGTAREADGG